MMKKTIMLLTLTAALLSGQKKDVTIFQLEDETILSTEVDVPKGSVQDTSDFHIFTSEDKKVTVNVPRTDRVKPSVTSSLNAGVYIYTVSNDPSASKAIELIRLLENGTGTLNEVQTDPRFVFVDIGWVSTNGGIRPGESAGFKVRADAAVSNGHIEMQFMNSPPATELPADTPMGLASS
jgi:hypothetical protein